MSDISSNILAAQAAGRIPDGISLDYLAESEDGPTKVVIIVLGSLSLLVVLARCYARMFLINKMGLDDALTILSVVRFLVPFDWSLPV